MPIRILDFSASLCATLWTLRETLPSAATVLARATSRRIPGNDAGWFFRPPEFTARGTPGGRDSRRCLQPGSNDRLDARPRWERRRRMRGSRGVVRIRGPRPPRCCRQDPETMRRPSGLTATDSHRILVPGELVDAGAGLEVPDRHGVVVGPRDDASAVGAHRHGTHRILMPGEPVDAGAGLEVPDRHGVVVGPGDDASAVGAHRHGTHPILVPGEPVDSGAGLEVPDRHGLVVRTPRRCVGRRGSPPRNSPQSGAR